MYVLVSFLGAFSLVALPFFLGFFVDLGTVNLAMVERAIGRRKTTSGVRIIAILKMVIWKFLPGKFKITLIDTKFIISIICGMYFFYRISIFNNINS